MFYALTYAESNWQKSETHLRAASENFHLFNQFNDEQDLFASNLDGDMPIKSYSKFYGQICDTYITITDAIEHRLSNKLDMSTNLFNDARKSFGVYSQDLSLPQSERNLCHLLSLWVEMQCLVNDYTLGINIDTDAFLRMSSAAQSRAVDGLREYPYEYIVSFCSTAKDIIGGNGIVLFDRHAIINKVLLVVPVPRTSPLDIGNIISIHIESAVEKDKSIVLKLSLSIRKHLLSHLTPKFNVHAKVFINETEVYSVALVKNVRSAKYEETLKETITIPREERPFVFDNCELVTVIRFANFEWPISTPFTLSLDEIKEYSMTQSLKNSKVVDFAIVTALEEELRAVLRQMDSFEIIQDEQDPITYYCGTLPIPSTEEHYELVVTWLLGMGNNHAAVTASKTLARWSPVHIIMVGIAGGVRRRVTLGDVIVASFCYYYELKKVYDAVEQLRPQHIPTDSLLFERARAFNLSFHIQRTPKKQWQELIEIDRPKKRSSRKTVSDAGENETDPTQNTAGLNDMPIVHFGPIASGEEVIQSAERVKALTRQCHGLLATAMEGAGVARAALMDSNRSRFLEVRGVSDYAGPGKNDDWHEYAATAAAVFLFEFLKSRPISPR